MVGKYNEAPLEWLLSKQHDKTLNTHRKPVRMLTYSVRLLCYSVGRELATNLPHSIAITALKSDFFLSNNKKIISNLFQFNPRCVFVDATSKCHEPNTTTMKREINWEPRAFQTFHIANHRSTKVQWERNRF